VFSDDKHEEDLLDGELEDASEFLKLGARVHVFQVRLAQIKLLTHRNRRYVLLLLVLLVLLVLIVLLLLFFLLRLLDIILLRNHVILFGWDSEWL